MTATATAKRRANAHPHGTKQRYVYGCRCTPCRTAQSEYRARCAAGILDTVDADAARTHARRLRDVGWTVNDLADRTDVNPSAISHLIAGRTSRVARTTADALLAVEVLPRSIDLPWEPLARLLHLRWAERDLGLKGAIPNPTERKRWQRAATTGVIDDAFADALAVRWGLTLVEIYGNDYDDLPGEEAAA